MINGISYVISTKRKQTWRWLQPIHTILHNVTPITVALWISDQQSHDVEVPLSESWSPDVSLKMFGKCCWWFTGCFFHSCGCDSPEEERSALMKDIIMPSGKETVFVTSSVWERHLAMWRCYRTKILFFHHIMQSSSKGPSRDRKSVV